MSVTTLKHLCCQYCTSQCECDSCDQDLSDYEKYKIMGNAGRKDTLSPVLNRTVTHGGKTELKLTLVELNELLDKEVSSESSCYAEPEIIYGLGLEVVSCIIEIRILFLQ